MNFESDKFKAEVVAPEDRNASLVGLIVLFALLLYGGLLYVDRCSGDFNPLVYTPYHNLKEVADLQFGPKVDPRGERIYSVTCAPCHQASGMGTPGLYPPLAGSEWVNEKNPARIIRIPLRGLNGTISVKGQDWNPPAGMPNIGDSLPEEDLAAVLTYVRQAWGNQAPPVTAEQIKKIKQEVTNHPGNWTADELKAVSVQ